MLASKAEALHNFDVNGISPKDILLARIETERLEVIPLNKVLTDSALIDDAHATELGISMKQKRGQITPIAVRARISEENGEVVYDIIDGFHRAAGKKQYGDRDINATVIYQCSDDEMFDLRILAASSVRSVQFARVAEWMTRSYETTPWAKKGLSVSQAFGMVVAGSKRSNLVEMNREELAELNKWAKAKCTRWGKTPASVYEDLRVVSNADPGLVKEVRIATGGYSREIKITQGKLALVVNAFPGNANHIIQREILHFAIDNKLKKDQIKIIIESLRDKIRPGITEEEVRGLMKNINLERTSKKNEFVVPTRQENPDETNDPLVLKQKIKDLELIIKRLKEANITLTTRLAGMLRLQNLKSAPTNERVIFERLPKSSSVPKPATSEFQSDRKPANNSVRITKENIDSFIPEFTEKQLKELEQWNKEKVMALLAKIPKSYDTVSSRNVPSMEFVDAVLFIKNSSINELKSLEQRTKSDTSNIELINTLNRCIQCFDQFPQFTNISSLFNGIQNELKRKYS